MKSFCVFLIIFILTVLFYIPVQASSVPFSPKSASEQSFTPNPYSIKNKVKKLKVLKKVKKVQSNQTAGILIFIIGCMITLVGTGIIIVAITDAILTIGLGIFVLGFVVMCIGDIIGNLGLMNLILNLCDCLSVLL